MAFVAAPLVSVRPSAATTTSSASTFRGARLAVSARRVRSAALSMNLESVQEKIQEEMKKAQEATAKFGKASREAALAWDVVEELEAEASHIKSKQGSKDPLDAYCKDVPEADECRVYED